MKIYYSDGNWIGDWVICVFDMNLILGTAYRSYASVHWIRISSIQVQIKFSSSSHTYNTYCVTHVSKSIRRFFNFIFLAPYYHLHLNYLHRNLNAALFLLFAFLFPISIKLARRLQCTVQQNLSHNNWNSCIFLTMCFGSIQQYKLTVDAVVYIILSDALTWFSSLAMGGGT